MLTSPLLRIYVQAVHTCSVMAGAMLTPPDLKAVSVVQATVQRLIEVRQTSNRNITNELRQVRDYKNPDFLQKMVKHFGVRDKGSCFPKDVFDPEALPKEDFYTACVPVLPPACIQQ